MASRICLNKENIILLFCILLLCSCSNEVGRRLHDADAVMEENPDSALTILMRIDTLSISSRDLPYYALLLTQARVKTRVPSPSDSLIRIALHEYDGAWWGDKGIRSNHYMGEVLDENGDPRGAMKHFLSAYEESKRLGNDYWRAKSAERISDLFFDAYNYDEAERFTREAIEFYGKSGRITNQRYALGALGIVYINNHKIKEAEQLLDSLYKVCALSLPADSSLIGYVRRPMIDILLETGRTNEITNADYELIQNASSDGEQIDAAILLNNISQSAEDTIGFQSGLGEAKLLAHTIDYKALLFYEFYRSEKAVGNLSAALSYVDSLLFYQCALTEGILKESVSIAQKEFYSNKSDQEEKQAKYSKYILGLSVIVFLLVVLIIWRYYSNKALKHRLELESIMESTAEMKDFLGHISEDNQELKDILKSRDLTVSQLQSDIADHIERENEYDNALENLYKEKWETLNMLCNQYFEFGDSEKTKAVILKNIEKHLYNLSNRKKLSEIEDAVNRYMGNIIDRLRKQCTFLKEDDIILLTLIYAGFSVRAVCLLTGIKYRNFYLKKSRLSKRILASDAPDKESFVSRISLSSSDK